MPPAKHSESRRSTKWTKSRKDRVIDGVCSGLAEYLGADVTLVRIVWLLSIFVKGLGLIAYILAAIIVPVNPEHKSLKPDEKKKINHAVIWSLVLISLGFLFLWDRWDWHLFRRFPLDFNFFPWGHIPWNSFLPLALIVLGVVYIVIALRKDRQSDPIPDDTPPPKKTGSSAESKPSSKMVRSRDNRLVGGVCGAIAKHLNIDPTLIRIGFVVITLITHLFLGLIAYVTLLIIIPSDEASTDSEKNDK